jgi:hypothetical protein
MKYIITETQLKFLVENNFRNQQKIDAILDKINKQGYGSLNDLEKQILNNPDTQIEDEESEQDSNCINELAELLISHNLVDEENINIQDEFIEIYEFKDAPNIKWFNGENYLILYCIYDGKNLVYMDFKDDADLYDALDSFNVNVKHDFNIRDRDEVYDHLKNVWEQQLPNTEFSIEDDLSDEF